MPADARAGRRAKYTTLLLLVLGSGLALLAATQPWFAVRLSDAANHSATITVAGSVAAPALTALALAGLALTAALAIAGPVFRLVLGLLGILLGVSVLISAITAMSDAVRASASAITGATGVAGDASVRRLVHAVDTQFWPWLAVVAGVVIVLASAAVIVFSRLWPGPSRKYQTRFAGEDGRPAEEVVAEAADDGTGAQESGADTPGGPAALDRDTAIDSWDELTRGDDPTR
jgi:uncharacterized membrane protein (TIGR02234 family)